MADGRDYCDILSTQSKAVAHLRWQFEKKRFGLVLGAGISKNFNVPMWRDLVNQIAADPLVDGTRIISGNAEESSLPYKTEMLFQKFREKQLQIGVHGTPMESENTVSAEWLKLCQRHIYGDQDFDLAASLGTHPYLLQLLPLVQESYLTINFNFDDFLERSLALNKRKEDKGNRGFEAVTDPWPQFRRTNSVVYHPHGYVPAGIMEGPVDRFVFSEASYSKQYVGARGHDTSFLIAHFARNTCLLIGCSLEDELRNVLMRGAQINPGNYHYYVHFLKDEQALDPDERHFIEETNFKVYNLITLFLSAKEIGLLLSLINFHAIEDKVLKDYADMCGVSLKFTYYMTGAIGVGKSTTANLLRSLSVLDEWLDPRLPILGLPWDQLTPEECDVADAWIADQFMKKNDTLRHLDKAVISVVDRPPLDPLAFTKEEDRPEKAASLLKIICKAADHQIERGVVILLLGDPEELSARVKATGRSEYTTEKLAKMQTTMRAIYEGQPGVVVIDTKYLSIPELTKQVARIIHRKDYAPADLMGIMKSYQEKAHAPS